MSTPNAILKSCRVMTKGEASGIWAVVERFPISLLTPATPVFFPQKPAFSAGESKLTKFGLHQ